MSGASISYNPNPRFVPDDIELRFGATPDAAILFDSAANELTLQTTNALNVLQDRLKIDTGTATPNVSMAVPLVVDDTTDATSITAGAIVSAGGIAAAKSAIVGEDLTIGAAAANRQFRQATANIQGVDTTAGGTQILDFNASAPNGGLVLVIGHLDTGADTAFLDLILVPEEAGGTPVVIQAISTRGTPAARTYSVPTERKLNLLMSAGSYDAATHVVSGAPSPL
ncbi:MAG: hypothetical protein HQ478_04685 [Chloroflexi bacterium]|nr:hypothetical protein [Chloroflexota bacterium]